MEFVKDKKVETNKLLKELKDSYKVNEKIKEAREAGLTVTEIARLVERHPNSIDNLLEDFTNMQERLLARINSYEYVRDEFKKGKKLKEIADHLGVSRQRIEQMIKHMELDLSKGGIRKRHRLIKERILELHEEGKVLEDMSEDVGVSVGITKRHIDELGLTVETRRAREVRLTREKILRLYYEEGKTQVEIAEIMGMVQTNISRILLDERNKAKKRGE